MQVGFENLKTSWDLGGTFSSGRKIGQYFTFHPYGH
jgi:hypothetical protein